MKIVICASVDLTLTVNEIRNQLVAAGHEVEIPFVSQQILAGRIDFKEFLAHKDKFGDLKYRQESGHDLIKRYYELIKGAEAILVVNGDKKGIKNYIGGNAFLEMGFAYILNKKIFLLNPIPDIPYYKDELISMQPVILNGDLSQLN